MRDKFNLSDFIQYIENEHGNENWISLFKEIKTEYIEGCLYSALATKEETKKLLNSSSWDKCLESGLPGFTLENGKASYKQNLQNGLKNIIFYRDFYQRKPSYLEISEEFRLFHNLFFDENKLTHIDFDDAGDEIEVVKITKNEVQVKKSYIESFMAATQQNLILYFEATEHFKHKNELINDIKSNHFCYTIYSGKPYKESYTSFTRCLGKKVINCKPIEECGKWPFEKPKKYESFLIEFPTGKILAHTCDPNKLANNFGLNAESPHFLTPVFFKKEVLDKYFSSSEYEITDGYIRRRGAWGLPCDNNCQEYISVFLGDLGESLPYKEQKYWEHFNIEPDGLEISDTNFQRNLLGNFFDPTSPEHKFKSIYPQVNSAWFNKYGWNLFHHLTEEDKHCFNSIRCMLTEEQSEFDELCLFLSKVLVDSINSEEIKNLLNLHDENLKSLDLLEKLFLELWPDNQSLKIDSFRNIQTLRSTGVAHKKGKNYKKAIKNLEVDANNYSKKIDQLLEEVFKTLTELNTLLK